MEYAQAEEVELYEEVGEEGEYNEFEEQTAIDQSISGVVVVIIFIALAVAFKLNRDFGGKLKAAISLFIGGVIVNLISAFWGSFVSHRVPLADSSFDTHNLLMAIAMVFFLVSILKFARLIPREA